MELEIAEGPGDSVTKNEPVKDRERSIERRRGTELQAWAAVKCGGMPSSLVQPTEVWVGSGHKKASWKDRWGLTVSVLLLHEAQMSGLGCLLVRQGQGSSWTLWRGISKIWCMYTIQPLLTQTSDFLSFEHFMADSQLRLLPLTLPFPLGCHRFGDLTMDLVIDFVP